jgi:hypothetical protein
MGRWQAVMEVNMAELGRVVTVLRVLIGMRGGRRKGRRN